MAQLEGTIVRFTWARCAHEQEAVHILNDALLNIAQLCNLMAQKVVLGKKVNQGQDITKFFDKKVNKVSSVQLDVMTF